MIIVRELVYPHVFRCKKDICLVEFDLFGCCYSSCVTKFDCTGAKHGKALLVGLHSRDGGASLPSKEPSHQSTNDSAAICSLFRLFRAFISLSFRFHFAFICTYIYIYTYNIYSFPWRILRATIAPLHSSKSLTAFVTAVR